MFESLPLRSALGFDARQRRQARVNGRRAHYCWSARNGLFRTGLTVVLACYNRLHATGRLRFRDDLYTERLATIVRASRLARTDAIEHGVVRPLNSQLRSARDPGVARPCRHRHWCGRSAGVTFGWRVSCGNWPRQPPGEHQNIMSLSRSVVAPVGSIAMTGLLTADSACGRSHRSSERGRR